MFFFLIMKFSIDGYKFNVLHTSYIYSRVKIAVNTKYILVDVLKAEIQ